MPMLKLARPREEVASVGEFNGSISRDSSGVEHTHGKGGVVSSNLILGSIFNKNGGRVQKGSNLSRWLHFYARGGVPAGPSEIVFGEFNVRHAPSLTSPGPTRPVKVGPVAFASRLNSPQVLN